MASTTNRTISDPISPSYRRPLASAHTSLRGPPSSRYVKGTKRVLRCERIVRVKEFADERLVKPMVDVAEGLGTRYPQYHRGGDAHAVVDAIVHAMCPTALQVRKTGITDRTSCFQRGLKSDSPAAGCRSRRTDRYTSFSACIISSLNPVRVPIRKGSVSPDLLDSPECHRYLF